MLRVPVFMKRRPIPMRMNVPPKVPMTRVLKGRCQGSAVAAQSDEDVRRQGRDFQEDEDVECIAGDDDAEEPGQ